MPAYAYKWGVCPHYLKPIEAKFNKPLFEYGQPVIHLSSHRKACIPDDGNKHIPTQFGYDFQLLRT